MGDNRSHGLFRQNFNGTGTRTRTKLASIILHGSFHTATSAAPYLYPYFCIYIGPVSGLGLLPAQALSE